jgi:UDP-GlcNAc3NAcA epimerase
VPTDRRPKVLSVLSSRPEVIQAAALATGLLGRVDEVLVHTGQHYDRAMSSGQISDTRLAEPAFNLGIGSLPDADQLELGESRIGEVISQVEPDAVIVRGDTNGTLAGARAATRHGLPVIHVEAGLRSHRPDMPEERNRVETDRLSGLLCAPTDSARSNLLAEHVRGEVRLTGDVLYDIFVRTRERVPASDEARPYALATIHRNYNTDSDDRLAQVLDALAAVPYRVVMPVHPRTSRRLNEAGLEPPANVDLREPVTYTQMLALERDAEVILTDSGGVQREAYMWGVPCITLREETEWVETVTTGWNVLTGVDAALVAEACRRPRPARHPAMFGDGSAASTIGDCIVAFLAGVRRGNGA